MMEESDQPFWYALSVRSRFEKKAHALLLEKGIESFLPLIEEVHVWSDRKKHVLEPLFRGYLFVHTDLHARLAILQTDGVVRFVSTRNHPDRIPDEQIHWVRILAGHPDHIEREPSLAQGERVKVNAGVFKDVVGIVKELRGSTRVVVNVEAIAQALSVEIPPEYLEKIN